MLFPVVGTSGKPWPLSRAMLNKLASTFPGVDAEAECIKAAGWCDANASKRKTPRGMQAFLWRWLEKAQNRQSPARASPADSVGFARPSTAAEFSAMTPGRQRI
jgi:hypothetical protein